MKISIITSSFNSAATIENTLNSVLLQTYKNIEYLIIDAASKDKTMDIIRAYEPKFGGRLKYVSEPDKGIYDAMNKGLSLATGDIIGILNSDDFYTSNTILQQIVDTFEKDNSLDAVYGDVHFVNHDNLEKNVRYYSSKIFRRWMMRLGFMPAHPSFYCRLKCYKEFGGFDTSFKIGADFENLLRLIYVHRIKIKYLPIDFVTMRIGGISTSGLSSHKQIMRDHLRACKKNGIYTNIFILGLRYFYKILELLETKYNKKSHQKSV